VERETHAQFEVTVRLLSVARKRQVKAENPSACAAVNWRKCEDQRLITSCVYKFQINPIIESKPCSLNLVQTPTRDTIEPVP
jgi:hypothetical protein